MQFPRIHADDQGETHIGVLDLPEHEARVGPPPNPLGRMTGQHLRRLRGPGRNRGTGA